MKNIKHKNDMRLRDNRFFLLTALIINLILTPQINAQVTIGEDPNAPHGFSLMEIISSSSSPGGLRLPQLTTIERNNLDLASNPTDAKGLVIYNTDTGCLEFWNGTVWISLCTTPVECAEITGVSISSSHGTGIAINAPFTLTANITPSDATIPATYEWRTSPNGSSWSAPISGQTSATLSQSISSTGVIHYQVTATNACSSESATIIINVESLPYIDIPGQAAPRIYVDHNNGDPRLVLTRDPYTQAGIMQFGNIVVWNFGNLGPADYNPTNRSDLNDWINNVYGNSSDQIAHNIANLNSGKGDPCRLVGFTKSEVNAAITGPNAYAIDNGIWRLPTNSENAAWELQCKESICRAEPTLINQDSLVLAEYGSRKKEQESSYRHLDTVFLPAVQLSTEMC